MFDKYDRENGYLTDEEERKYYRDIAFQIYDIAIKKGMSFNDCEEMDILGYIDYLEYTIFRKENQETGDIEW